MTSIALVFSALLVGCGDDDSADASTDSGVDATTDDILMSDAPTLDTPSADGGTPEPWACRGESIAITGVAAGADIEEAIEAAADAASDHDCLVLPAGEFVMRGDIDFFKPLSLIGQGSGEGGTWIHRPADIPDDELRGRTMFSFLLDSRESSDVVIMDLRISSRTPSFTPGDGGSLAEDTGIALRGVVDFVVTHCRFEYFGFAGLSVRHEDDLSRGLVAENEFFHNLKGDGLGLGYGVVVTGANLEWVPSPQYGTDNFIFIEDNHFLEHRHAIAAGGAGRYVSRYNVMVDNLWGHAIDGHDGRGGSPGDGNFYATRAVEAYNNTLRNDHFADGTPISPGEELGRLSAVGLGFRGGEAIAHHNHIEGFLFGIMLIAHIDQPADWETSYPYRYQIGYASAVSHGAEHSGTGASESAGDFFEWENTFVPYAPAGQERKFWLDSSVHIPDALRADRDYHVDTPLPGYTPYVYPHPARLSR